MTAREVIYDPRRDIYADVRTGEETHISKDTIIRREWVGHVDLEGFFLTPETLGWVGRYTRSGITRLVSCSGVDIDARLAE